MRGAEEKDTNARTVVRIIGSVWRRAFLSLAKSSADPNSDSTHAEPIVSQISLTVHLVVLLPYAPANPCRVSVIVQSCPIQA